MITSSPGLDRREDRRAERLGRAAGHADLVGVEVEPVMAVVMRRDRLAQRRQPARRRILVRALLQRPRGRVEDLVGPAEIGKALPQVDRAMLARRAPTCARTRWSASARRAGSKQHSVAFAIARFRPRE